MTEKEKIMMFLKEFKSRYKSNGMEGIKSTYVRLMEALRRENFTSVEKFEREAEIIRECYDFLCSHKIRTQVPNLNNTELYDLFLEMKLDDKKRQYDMSELFDESLIAIKNNHGVSKRAIVVINEEEMKEKETGKRKETPILDSMGRCIVITPIGAIGYDNALQARKFLTKYLIQKESSEGKIEEYTVYSEINILQLSTDEEYTQVVSDELLSDRNLKLCKADGYIGKIEPAVGEVSVEKFTSQGYTYQVTNNYRLNYDAEDLTAVGIVAKNLLFCDKKPLIGEVLTPEKVKEMYGVTLIDNITGDDGR